MKSEMFIFWNETIGKPSENYWNVEILSGDDFSWQDRHLSQKPRLGRPTRVFTGGEKGLRILPLQLLRKVLQFKANWLWVKSSGTFLVKIAIPSSRFFEGFCNVHYQGFDPQPSGGHVGRLPFSGTRQKSLGDLQRFLKSRRVRST